MRWCHALVLVAACRGADREQVVPHGGVAASVPEHYELSTLPATALPPMATEIGNGKLAGPETVIHDIDQDVYFVSNINGNPNEADDNGYISMVSPMGGILDRYFIDGRQPDVTLHAPRGMAIGGDTLYVVDKGAVRLFDRKTGEPTGTWEIPDEHFANDIAIDAQGNVLVTETGVELTPTGPKRTGPYRIYSFDANGRRSVLAQGDDLHGPNGIVAGPDGIFVVEFMDDEHGVYKLDAQGKKELFGTLPNGQLDGLVLLPDGSMLVSSWLANGIYRFVPGEAPTLVVQHLITPAGIHYDAIRGRILIPEVLGNTLHIESWAPPAAQLKPMSERW